MDLKIQSIRFSKDFFQTMEDCSRWLDGKKFPILTQKELDNFFVYDQISQDKFVDVSLQEYKLDAGVTAIVGIHSETPASISSMSDTESLPIQDETTKLKTSVNTFADNLGKLVGEFKSSITVSKKENKDSDNEFEFIVPIYKAIEKAEEKIAFGPVLIPNEVDGQAHIYDEKAVEDACHYWMEAWQEMGEMHTKSLEDKQYAILESFIAPADYELNGHSVKKGTWMLMVRVSDAELWKKIKDGELNAFSIGGVATVEDLEEEDDSEEQNET